MVVSNLVDGCDNLKAIPARRPQHTLEALTGFEL